MVYKTELILWGMLIPPEYLSDQIRAEKINAKLGIDKQDNYGVFLIASFPKTVIGFQKPKR